MILEKLIAEAWEQERARYFITNKDAPIYGLVEISRKTDRIVLESRLSTVEAHLSALCARAVMRALQEAGYGIVEHDAISHPSHDLIPAELEQA